MFISDHDYGTTDYQFMLQPPIERKLVCANVGIGKLCWIGHNTCILKGVSIGNNCMVAAGAVVTRSFPS